MILAREELLEGKIEDDDEDYKKAFLLLDGDNNGEITKVDLSNFIKAHLGILFISNFCGYAYPFRTKTTAFCDEC